MQKPDLSKYYFKKIKRKKIYRLMSCEYINNNTYIINPKKNPFSNKYDQILQLSSLILRLEERGNVFYLDWGGELTKLSTVMKISLNDLLENSLDFTTSREEVLSMNKKWKGGALATNIQNIYLEINKERKILSKSEKSLLDDLNDWAYERSLYKNIILSINCDSKSLEYTKFQHRIPNRYPIYWLSPFGRYKYFLTNIINKKQLNKYIPFIIGDKNAYIRVSQEIDKKEVLIIEPENL